MSYAGPAGATSITSYRARAGWIVVRVNLRGIPSLYCNHKHLSEESAERCRRRWSKRAAWPLQFFVIVESESGR